MNPAPNLRWIILRRLNMHGVGLYSSINDIIEAQFPVNKSNCASLTTTSQVVKDFLQVLVAERSVKLSDTSWQQLGLDYGGSSLPLWLDAIEISATITGDGERMVMNYEREIAEAELHQSIIDTNKRTVKIIGTQTRIFWFTMAFTVVSAVFTGLNYWKSDSKHQSQSSQQAVETLPRQIQKTQSLPKNAPFPRITVTDSSTSGH